MDNTYLSSLKVKLLVTQSCPTLWGPMDCSPPGSSVHGILQPRILEWVAISFSRGSSQPKDWTRVSCIAGRLFSIWATRKAHQALLPRNNFWDPKGTMTSIKPHKKAGNYWLREALMFLKDSRNLDWECQLQSNPAPHILRVPVVINHNLVSNPTSHLQERLIWVILSYEQYVLLVCEEK